MADSTGISTDALKGVGYGAVGVGGVVGALSVLSAYKAKRAGYLANAANIRSEANQDFDASVTEEMLQRVNQGLAMGTARAQSAGSGFDGTGTGDVGERTVAGQYEQAIANAAYARDVGYAKAQYAAGLEEWKAKLAKKERNLDLLGVGVKTASSVVTMGLM